MTQDDLAARARQDIEKLVAILKPEDRKLLLDMAESELISLHLSYGMGLRNQWRHGGFPDLCKYCSAQIPAEKRSLDAVSAVAIREIWRYLRSSAAP